LGRKVFIERPHVTQNTNSANIARILCSSLLPERKSSHPYPKDAGKDLEFNLYFRLYLHSTAHNLHWLPHIRENPPRKATTNLPPIPNLTIPRQLSLVHSPRPPSIRSYSLYPPRCLQPRNEIPTRTLQQRFRERCSRNDIRGCEESVEQ
jgi:hypothetical protein